MLIRVVAVTLLFATSMSGAGAFAHSASAAGGTGTILAQADSDTPDDQGAAPDPGSPAAFVVRIERLESRIRTMTGQIEQLEFQNKRLEDNLRKMQQDVDFRFQDLGHNAQPAAPKTLPLKRGELDGSPGGNAPADTATPLDAGARPAPRNARKTADAFDPAADPDAPGAPKPLGTTPPSLPVVPRATAAASREGSGRQASTASATPDSLSDESRAPLNLVPNAGAPANRPASPTAAADSAVEAAVPAQSPARSTPNPASVASLTPGSTRAEYDGYFSLYKGGQFDAAANGLQSFIQKYPKDRLVPDATYFLGESFARLGRHREAAEQFLKVSTDYTRSTRAPDALLRLGVALNALGAKEQACATYQEVDRKYPTASPDVRAGVERELKRAKC